MDLSGTFTALVTPFQDDLSIDWAAYEKFCEGQIAAGITGLIPCGTTGESPALDHEEQIELVKRTVKIANKRTKVIAGTGTSATRSTIALSQAAERAGVDALMVVVPYYNKPTQDGLFAHFTQVAASVKIPVIVYNVPHRTSMDLSADTLARIAEKSPNVLATKEATGNVLRAQEVARKTKLTILSGDDTLTLPMMSIGAKGVISVASNLYPAEVGRVVKLALEGKWDDARREHLRLLPLYESMFVEANPSPVKAALALKGIMKEVVRGPNVSISAGGREKVAAAIRAYESPVGDRQGQSPVGQS